MFLSCSSDARTIDISMFSKKKGQVTFGLLEVEIVNKINRETSHVSVYAFVSSLLFLYRAPFRRISVLTRFARSGIINRFLSFSLSLFHEVCSFLPARSPRVYFALSLEKSVLSLSLSSPSLFLVLNYFLALPFSSSRRFPTHGFLALSSDSPSSLFPRSLPTCPLLPSTPSSSLPLTRFFPRAFPICLSFPLASPFSLSPYPPPSSICLPRAILRASIELGIARDMIHFVGHIFFNIPLRILRGSFNLLPTFDRPFGYRRIFPLYAGLASSTLKLYCVVRSTTRKCKSVITHLTGAY